MTAGNMVKNLIFGYASIDNLSKFTDILEGNVLRFVNTIAQIIQTCAKRWDGVPTAAVSSDTFLLTWKPIEEATGSLVEIAAKNTKFSETADRALMAFVKVLCETRRSPTLSSYQGLPAMRSYMQTQPRGSPLPEVELSLALTAGWAIELTIGSDFKVDANFMSPSTYISSVVLQMCPVFGMQLLLTERFYMNMSLRAKEKCRRLDTVQIWDTVTGLYTFDMDASPSCLLPWQKGHTLGGLLLPEEIAEGYDTETLEADATEYVFNIDLDVQKFQEKIPQQLRTDYREGLSLVQDGKWAAAREKFEKILSYWPDRPSECQLLFLDIFGPDAPEDWAGYHPLDEDFVVLLHDRARGENGDADLLADRTAIVKELNIRRSMMVAEADVDEA
jgi:hypothetical protein